MDINEENFVYGLLGRQHARLVSAQMQISALMTENAELKANFPVKEEHKPNGVKSDSNELHL